jgi:hypothetical protein
VFRTLTLVLLMFSIPALSAAAGNRLRPMVAPFPPNYFFNGNEHIKDVAGSDLQELLQGFVDSVQGRGFLQVGDARDFDHGHLLYGKGAMGRPEPVCVLYHTQEDSNWRAQHQAGLEPDSRNWIQWFGADKPVVNARAYARADATEVFGEYASAGTIISPMLDPKRLGTPIVRDVQWAFRAIPCDSTDDTLLKIKDHRSQTICLTILPR